MKANIGRTNQVIRFILALSILIPVYGRFIQLEHTFLLTLFAVGLLISSVNRFSPFVFVVQFILSLLIRD